MRHAALHVQGQHIIWQQFLMKLDDTFAAPQKSKENPHKL
jgi:hypothetical protein